MRDTLEWRCIKYIAMVAIRISNLRQLLLRDLGFICPGGQA